jgi:outer membrane protein insertion porin family
MPLTLARLTAIAAGCLAIVLAVCGVGATARADEPLPAPDRYGLTPSAPPAEGIAAPAPEPGAGETVAEVRIVGNETTSTTQIAGPITTRAGRPFDRAVVQRDVRTLASQGWFVDVKSLYEMTPQGRVVIFQVVERPTIRYVSYLGNKKVSDKKLAKQTLLKVGGSVDPYSVEEGRRKIKDYYVSKGYNNVQITILEGNRVTDQGVVYLIHEDKPQKFWDVNFVGNEFVGASRLKTLVKSKPPVLMIWKGFVDREKIDADKDLLTAYYRSYGFFQARISPHFEFNDEGDWLTITWVIHEGEQYQVRDVRFMGVTKFGADAMSQQLKLTAGQPFEQAKMQVDTQWVQDLYGSNGYVFADVRPETVFLEEPGQVDLIYHIDEGQKWRVGRIFVHIGGDNPHTRIQTALNRCTVYPGQILDIRELKASERRLMASSVFHVDQATGQRPKITFNIPEDADLGLASRPQPRVRGQSPDNFGPPVLPPPGTPGFAQPAVAPPPPTPDGSDIHVFCDDYEHYLRWCDAEREAGAVPAKSAEELSQPVKYELNSLPPIEPTPSASPAEAQPPAVFRGQSPQAAPTDNMLNSWQPQWQPTRPVAVAPAEVGDAPARWDVDVAGDPVRYRSAYAQSAEPSSSSNPYMQIRGQSPGPAQSPYAQVGNPQTPASGVQQAYATVPAGGVVPQYGGQVVRATGPESAQMVGSGVQPAQYSPQLQPPAGSIYPTPLNTQGPLPGYSVDPTSPYYSGPGDLIPAFPEGLVDIHINGSETQTGRLMLGVGVNSDAGVVGNIVVDERNFDWKRLPTSWEDVRNGTAFRGDGQRFRIDASPGSQVNRYLVQWQNPYFLDRPVNLSLSGSYFDRRFRDWDEQRLGGRVGVGYQWVERDLSATVSYRGENVNIRNISAPGVLPELDEVVGDNVLHGFRLTVIRDTRDNPFLATQGHYLEIGGEQVIGTFDYPRVDVDARKYWLLHERPDHAGRHVMSFSTSVGYTGTHTPIYEHYFAGGFSTMRGFDFRGASPVVSNIQVGGEFQWLNSAQYLFPITADEMLHGVVFCDFGTVEQNVTIKDFRVAPGAGLRITVPAMGPAPIALDFAWAVNHADFDDRQVFSFSLGFSR